MTEGAGLRQSHFGSGHDAGKARLQAEVEQLKGQIAAMEAVVEAARYVMTCGMSEEGSALAYLDSALARLDAADMPADHAVPAAGEALGE